MDLFLAEFKGEVSANRGRDEVSALLLAAMVLTVGLVPLVQMPGAVAMH